MNIDYKTLADDVETGLFRQGLEQELTIGFRQLLIDGERLPVASHYAAQIAEIVNAGAPVPLAAEFAYYVYQEILLAVENARLAAPPL